MNRYNFVFPNLSLTNPIRKVSAEETPSPMPEGFTPGPNHVICGRGKQCQTHNEGFRSLVASRLAEYSAAPSKPERSRIVTLIYEEIIRNGGGFVRKDFKTGRWLSLPETPGREKISQAFRDSLTDQYQSSKVCRRQKRKQAREESSSCGSSSDEESEDEEEETRVVKKARTIISSSTVVNTPSSPIQTLKTSDALKQLLKFAGSIDVDSLSSSASPDVCSSNAFQEDVEADPFGYTSFHPIQYDDDKLSSRRRASKRYSFSDISIGILDFEDITPFPALSV